MSDSMETMAMSARELIDVASSGLVAAVTAGTPDKLDEVLKRLSEARNECDQMARQLRRSVKGTKQQDLVRRNRLRQLSMSSNPISAMDEAIKLLTDAMPEGIDERDCLRMIWAEVVRQLSRS